MKKSAFDLSCGTWFTLRAVASGVMMRGTDEARGSLFGDVDLEERIPVRHPLREVRRVANGAPASADAEVEALSADFGRPSIAPGRLPTTEMSRRAMAAIPAHRELAPLLPGDRFSVDGTPPEARASTKRLRAEGGRHAARRRSGRPARTGCTSRSRSPDDRTRDRRHASPRSPEAQCRSRLPGREAVRRHPPGKTRSLLRSSRAPLLLPPRPADSSTHPDNHPVARRGRPRSLARRCLRTGPVAGFARGLRADQAAVAAALRLPWRNAQTEGHIIELKLVNRHI